MGNFYFFFSSPTGARIVLALLVLYLLSIVSLSIYPSQSTSQTSQPIQNDHRCLSMNGQCQLLHQYCNGIYLTGRCPKAEHNIHCCVNRSASVYQERQCTNEGGRCQLKSEHCNGQVVSAKCPKQTTNAVHCCRVHKDRRRRETVLHQSDPANCKLTDFETAFGGMVGLAWIHQDFLGTMQELDWYFEESASTVKMLIKGSFWRRPANPVPGATAPLYTYAKSNHYAGYAINYLLQYPDAQGQMTLCDQTCLELADDELPTIIKQFFDDLRDYIEFNWVQIRLGRYLNPRLPLHLDGGLNEEVQPWLQAFEDAQSEDCQHIPSTGSSCT